MRKIVLLFILQLCTTLAWSITLDECHRLARENYPMIRLYDILEKTKSFTLEMAGKAWLPQMQLSAQTTWQNNAVTYPAGLEGLMNANGLSVKGMAKDQYRISFDLQQTVYDGGRIRAQKDIIQAESEEKQRMNDVEMYALDERVDELFFGILLLGEQIKTVEAGIELLSANKKMMEGCLQNGTAMQADVNAIAAELLTLQQQRINIEATKESFARVLALYIDKEIDHELELPEGSALGRKFNLTKPMGSLQMDLNHRPELAFFNAQQQTLQRRKQELNTTFTPSLFVFTTLFYGYPGLNSMEAIALHDWSWNVLVGARLTWDLSPFYTKKSKLGHLNMLSENIEVQRETFLFNQQLQATDAQDEVNRLEKMAESDHEIVALHRSVRMAEEAKLREGIINSTQLLQKITEELNATIVLKAHQIEKMRAEQKVRHIIGL